MNRFSARRLWYQHILAGVLALLLVTSQIAYHAHLRPPEEAFLRQVDALFATGHYYTAFQYYHWLGQHYDSPATHLRLGMIYTVRGETAPAERALWGAISRDLSCHDHSIATIYLGHVLASRAAWEHANSVWQRTGPCTGTPDQMPHAGPRHIVQAEWALRTGDYTRARAHLDAALTLPLTRPWHTLATYRLALLQAASDPDAALARLATSPPTTQPNPLPLLNGLLPTSIRHESSQLYAVLQAAPTRRQQLLGQFYLDLGFDQLAARQFEQAASSNTHPLAAATHAAYTTWRVNQSPDGQQSLKHLATHQPDSDLLALLALTTIVQQLPTSASNTATLSQTLTPLAPQHASTRLAWAAWHLTQSDYLAASAAYQEALTLAPPTLRGPYALLVARFHLDTAYAICTDGLSAAQLAADLLPTSADALTTLAASHYQCGDFAAASTAARQALAQDAQRADATFYLGAAQARQGHTEHARASLISAADLAPASIWRERAELLLDMLPPIAARQ